MTALICSVSSSQPFQLRHAEFLAATIPTQPPGRRRCGLPEHASDEAIGPIHAAQDRHQKGELRWNKTDRQQKTKGVNRERQSRPHNCWRLALVILINSRSCRRVQSIHRTERLPHTSRTKCTKTLIRALNLRSLFHRQDLPRKTSSRVLPSTARDDEPLIRNTVLRFRCR